MNRGSHAKSEKPGERDGRPGEQEGATDFLLGLLTVLWLLAVAAGLYCLVQYANQAAGRAGAPTTWPEHLEIASVGAKAELLGFDPLKIPCACATTRTHPSDQDCGES